MRRRLPVLVWLAAVLTLPLPAAWTAGLLASFPRPARQAQSPLVLHPDGNFYGTSVAGGREDLGTVYRVGAGGDLEILHSFSPAEGTGPVGGLVVAADGSLIGTATAGGALGFGTVFSLSTAGVFTKLVDFTGSGGSATGSVPGELMRHADGNFYGVTAGGGSAGMGTIFKMTPAGVVTTLVEFTGTSGTRPGAWPVGPLAASGDDLYGTTRSGGSGNLGTLFKVTTAGGWTSLGTFTGTAGAKPGEAPTGGLVLHSDGNFYGTTEFGGANGFGVAFRLTPGGVFTVLHEFADVTGAQAVGRLAQGGDSALYGLTATGGAEDWGTVFRLTTTGAHSVLVNLTGEAGLAPGAFPRAGLVPGNDGHLYAAIGSGGAGQEGVIMKLSPAGDYFPLASFSPAGGWAPNGGLVSDGAGGVLFMLAKGGTNGGGVLARWTEAGGVASAADLGGEFGIEPDGPLLPDGGAFLGVCRGGGTSGRGTAFRYEPGSGLSLLANDTLFSGSIPEGNLVSSPAPGIWLGAAREGGTAGLGTVYALQASGARTRLFSFTGNAGAIPGASPLGPLAAVADKSRYYGVTRGGGASGSGVIYRFSPAGTYTLVHSFSSTGPRVPEGGLVFAPDGFIYGTTSLGGDFDEGTVFRIDPATDQWEVVGSFTGTGGELPGSGPAGSLALDSGGRLYGLTAGGGSDGEGVVFRVVPGIGLETIAGLDGFDGATPGSTTLAADGILPMEGGIGFDPADGSLLVLAAGGGEGGGGVLLRLQSPLQVWKAENLPESGAGSLADPDGDGLPNLVEYALGSSPIVPGPSPFGLSVLGGNGGDGAILTLPRDPSRSDVTVIVEASSDLAGEWTALATSVLGAPFVGPGLVGNDPDTPEFRLVEIADPQPIAGTGERFYRVRVLE